MLEVRISQPAVEQNPLSDMDALGEPREKLWIKKGWQGGEHMKRGRRVREGGGDSKMLPSLKL